MLCMCATSAAAVLRPTPLRPAIRSEPPGLVSTRSTRATLSNTSLKRRMSNSRFSRAAKYTIHDTRARDKLRKTVVKRRWSHWACINFATNEKKFSLSSFNRLRTITTTQKNNVSPPPHFFEQSIKAAVCLLYFQNFNFCCNPYVQFQTEPYNISVTKPLQVIQQERGPSPRATGQREISRYNNTRACSHIWPLRARVRANLAVSNSSFVKKTWNIP